MTTKHTLNARPPGARPRPAMLTPLALPLFLGACFPGLQTPVVTPGFHVDAGAMALSDQVRNGEPQGADLFGWVTPSVGLGRRVELGVPIGIYLEEGMRSLTDPDAFGTSPRQLVIVPYAKFAFIDASRDKLAGVLSFGPTLLSSAQLLYGIDRTSWMPWVSVRWIASGGPAGDDPVITRYQESGQVLIAASGGVEWRVAGRPAIEAGALINHYDEGAVFGDFGQPTTPRTLADVFVMARVRVGPR